MISRSAIVWLLLGATAHAAPETTSPTLAAALIALSPRLVIDVRSDENGARRLVTLPKPTWRIEAGETAGDEPRYSAELDDAPSGLHATLRIARAHDEATAALTVSIEHRSAGWIALEAIDLKLSSKGAGAVLDRALLPHAIERVSFLDRFAAKTIRAGREVLLVGEGVDGVIARPAIGGPLVRVEIVAVEERPFRHDSRCAKRWKSPNKRVTSSARLARAGDRESAVIRLAEIAPGSAALTLAPARFPDGRRAALVITDHADQSAPDSLAALALGRSDATSPVGGLLGHHITITKSLFFHGDKRPQLEDARVVAVADALAKGGSEIVPHSATPHTDSREVTSAALDAFARYHAVTWIDHQPETNCEAFNNQGFRATGPFHIADLLESHGYRYVWAVDDLKPGTLDLLPPHLDQRATTLWPLGRLTPSDGDDRWMFRSSWMFLETIHFLRALAPARIDRLEQDRGLSILHTYLETLHRKRTRFGLRNLLVLGRDRVVSTDPRFEELLADLERREQRGSLWVPTVKALGDHLRALEHLDVRYLRDGSAVVRSSIAQHGVTFVVPGSVTVRVDGAPPRGVRVEGNSTTFWIDLAPDHDARVELSDGARPVRFLGP